MPQFDHLVSRATTRWRAKSIDLEQRPSDWDKDKEWPLILKLSWQYVTRDEEGRSGWGDSTSPTYQLSSPSAMAR